MRPGLPTFSRTAKTQSGPYRFDICRMSRCSCQGAVIIRRTCERDIIPMVEERTEGEVGEYGEGKHRGYGELPFVWSGLM